MVRLQIKPELGTGAKIKAQAQGGISTNIPLGLHNLTDAVWRNVYVFGKLSHRNVKGFEKFFKQYFTRRDRFKGSVFHTKFPF